MDNISEKSLFKIPKIETGKKSAPIKKTKNTSTKLKHDSSNKSYIELLKKGQEIIDARIEVAEDLKKR